MGAHKVFGKHMRFLITAFLLLPFLLKADELTHLSGVGHDSQVDKLSFTNTQRWGKEFVKFTRLRPKYLSRDWAREIGLAKPPANSSPRTTAEIAYLKKLTAQRAGKKSAIEAEVLVTNFRYGTHTYASLTTDPKYRATSKVILAAYHDLAIATFVMKQKFNRVRPSILDKDLGHTIQIPTHPAYPSGHATGAYVIAYLLQELDPESAQTYLKAAKQITENREIAGLHYPSDSEAGRLLARQLTDSLLNHSSFKRLMEEARKEWP